MREGATTFVIGSKQSSFKVKGDAPEGRLQDSSSWRGNGHHSTTWVVNGVPV